MGNHGATLMPATDTALDTPGPLSLDGASVVTGTEITSGNNSAQTVNGGYGIAEFTLGCGTVTFREPANLTGDFFAISPTKLVVVATTQDDPNPVIVVVGNSFVETVLRRSAGRAELSSAPSRTMVGANDAPTCILDRAVPSVRV